MLHSESLDKENNIILYNQVTRNTDCLYILRYNNAYIIYNGEKIRSLYWIKCK